MKTKLSGLAFTARSIVTALGLSATLLAIAADAPAPAPEISVSLRGVQDDVIEQGEPLRIVVRLTASSENPGVVQLAPDRGAWTDAIAVELVPVGGGTPVARAEVFGKPPTPHATLSADQVAGGLWRISADAMRRVAPGEYVVRGRLAIQSSNGWSGAVSDEETRVQVVAASDSAQRVPQRTSNRAHDAILDGRLEEAAGIVDPVLQRTPDDYALLMVRALIAERAGNPGAAMMCLNRVSRSLNLTGSAVPPIELYEQRTRVTAALLAREETTPDPPVWSWPPLAVLTRPESEISTGSAGSSNGSASNGGVGTIVAAAELSEAKILADPAGQWAAGATAGTQYGKTQYSAMQATGAPNIPVQGNSPNAWCPATRTNGTDWIELTFAKPVRAAEVRIRQNESAGAITQVEAIEPGGTAHVWWKGTDPYVTPAVREIVWFAVRVPKTEYLVARIKLTLNLASGPGYKEIDAVQLVAAP